MVPNSCKALAQSAAFSLAVMATWLGYRISGELGNQESGHNKKKLSRKQDQTSYAIVVHIGFHPGIFHTFQHQFHQVRTSFLAQGAQGRSGIAWMVGPIWKAWSKHCHQVIFGRCSLPGRRQNGADVEVHHSFAKDFSPLEVAKSWGEKWLQTGRATINSTDVKRDFVSAIFGQLLVVIEPFLWLILVHQIIRSWWSVGSENGS